MEISSSERYFSIISSLTSEIASSIISRYSKAISWKPSSISSSEYSAPFVSSSQIICFILTRSIIPAKLSSDPIGICSITGFAFNFSFMDLTAAKKSAPVLSILLIKAILGTEYLSACLHTVSDCGSTPPTAQKTPMAPSRTLKALSTSTVKSTCPGVSMIWITLFFHSHVVTADVMVIPLSCSSCIQSITASPS